MIDPLQVAQVHIKTKKAREEAAAKAEAASAKHFDNLVASTKRKLKPSLLRFKDAGFVVSFPRDGETFCRIKFKNVDLGDGLRLSDGLVCDITVKEETYMYRPADDCAEQEVTDVFMTATFRTHNYNEERQPQVCHSTEHFDAWLTEFGQTMAPYVERAQEE